jgi:hypothetical protein
MCKLLFSIGFNDHLDYLDRGRFGSSTSPY